MQPLNVVEDYSLRGPITGDALLSRLVLTGWGAVTSSVPALETWTDRGRLWWVFTQSTGDLSFYRRSTAGSGDKVCSGTASSGLVTLAQANSSGITGSVECSNGTLGTNPTQDSTGQVVVSYAHEQDLADQYVGVANYLDSNSKWNGQGTRFEAILRTTKRELDEHVASALGSRLRYDTAGRRQLADIADPRQLATVHALYALGAMEYRRAGMDPLRLEGGKIYMERALRMLRATNLLLDYESDALGDGEADMSGGKMVRG